MLKRIFAEQERLQKAMGYPMGHGDQGVKENILALIVECTEVLNEVNWKPWKKKYKVVDDEKLKTELADVLQFWVNTCQAAGYTPEEMLIALEKKWEVNHQRVKDGY